VREAELPLVGAGGEPVDFRRTLASHGVATLPPNVVDEETWQLTTTLDLNGVPPPTIRVQAARRGLAHFEVLGPAVTAGTGRRLVASLGKMFRLDEDLSGFYEQIVADEDLAWVAAGAGRMLRSPTVFEDVVKTICTTNCTWSATERMVGAIVGDLGREGPRGRAFPSAATMAEADESFYKDVARAGYRGAYLRSLAASVADGSVDLEALREPELPDDEVERRLLALPGVGPYAAAHVMVLIGRYTRLILDSWTRPKYATLLGKKTVADRTIARRFKRYGSFSGLAFWLFLTRDWVPD
jgi:3-methyladenine DNA glycosylase/8-oxoguanine DNA glycosylase